MGHSDSDSGYDSDVTPGGRHKCTDIPCMLVFVATMVGLVALVKHADTNGNVKQLYYGVDNVGNICGVSESVKDKKYLYWCPHVDFETDGVNFLHPTCITHCPGDNEPVGECGESPAAYPVKEVQGHSCLPALLDPHATATIRVAGDFAEKLGSDEMGMRHGKQVLAGAIVCGLLVGYIYLYLLRKTAKCLIYTFTILATLNMILNGVLLWNMKPSSLSSQYSNGRGSDGLRMTQWDAIGCWIAAALMVAVFFAFRKAINTSLACIQCAVLVMFKMPCLLLAPFKLALVKVTMWLSMLYGLFHLVALLEWKGTPGGMGFQRSIDLDSEVTQMVKLYAIFYVFAMIWALEFANAVYTFTISYAAGYYYFSEPDDDDDRSVPCTVLQEGGFVAIFYHTGSLAYGSIMVTIVSTLFWGVSFLDRQAKTGCNPCCRVIAQCLMCFCRCCSGMVGFINKNCYTEMAITGDHGFCGSIQGVLKVMVDQGAAMVIMNAATFIIQMQGMQVIVGSAMMCAFIMLQQDKYSNPTSESHIESKGLVYVMVAILSATVGWSFMSVFDAVTDSLLFCFAIDKMNNDGHVTTAPKDFLALYNDAEEILNRRNKKEDKKNKRANKKAEAAEPLVEAGGRPE